MSAAQDIKSRIAPELSVRGRVTGREDLFVAGRLEGSVELAGHLFVEPTGIVEADVVAITVSIEGVLVGDVAARRAIELRAGARVVGKLSAPRVAIEPGAQYRGAIEMAEPEAATQLPLPVEAATVLPASAEVDPRDDLPPVAEGGAPTRLPTGTPEPLVPGTPGAETIVPGAPVHQALTVIRPVDAAALEGVALGGPSLVPPSMGPPDSVLPAPELATEPPSSDGDAPQTTIGAAPDAPAAKSAVPDSSFTEWVSGEPNAADGPARPVEVAKAEPVAAASTKRRILVRRRT